MFVRDDKKKSVNVLKEKKKNTGLINNCDRRSYESMKLYIRYYE